MIKWVIIVLLSFFAIEAFGQSFEIRILDSETNIPLPFATLTYLQTGEVQVADQEGVLLLENSYLENNSSIAVQYLGYTSDTITSAKLKKKKRYILYLKPSTIETDIAIIVDSSALGSGLDYLNAIEGTSIFASKKNEIIKPAEVAAALSNNNSRQIYAKVPGLSVWESDQANIQLGVSVRGLDPNRSSHFNTRQNGYDISADALGYPESYYTPPAVALEQIQIVRGAASLQYGSQFGGLLNFILKQPPEEDQIAYTTENTAGSFKDFSTYHELSGKYNKVSWLGFYQFRAGEGWRDNSDYQQHTMYADVHVFPSKKTMIDFEFTKMNYTSQQPGGLTDALFEQDPSQSIRDRNWFAVDWNVAAMQIEHEISSQTKIHTRFFGLHGSRDALGFLGRINRVDPMEERDLLSGTFNNFGNETRLLHKYYIKNKPSAILIGGRAYRGYTIKKQGLGSDASDADFSYNNPEDLEGSDYSFPSSNYSLFAENYFRLGKLSITPGVRFEYIETNAEGYYKLVNTDLGGDTLLDQKIFEDRTRIRTVFLAGLGLSYHLNENGEFYANFSQNYRAINFNDLRITLESLRIDPNLSDESGYNFDIGFRSRKKNSYYVDLGYFYLRYNDKIGELLRRDDELFITYRYRTNISDAFSTGIEWTGEYNIAQHWSDGAFYLGVFNSGALMFGRYAQSSESAVSGNTLEYLPQFRMNAGLNMKVKGFKTSLQFTYVDDQYSDATNSIGEPNAVFGIIPGYSVVDFSVEKELGKFVLLGGINNILNNSYFTRRAGGYPGPGIIPASPRYMYLGMRLNLVKNR